MLHVPTIKPLDTATILREASRSGRMVVVAENHTVIGGLGEAVAGLLLREGVRPEFRQIGLPDAFLAAGALPTLHDRYGISASAMAEASQELAVGRRLHPNCVEDTNGHARSASSGSDRWACRWRRTW